MTAVDAGRKRYLAFVAFLTLFALALRLALFGLGPWQDGDRALRDDSRRYVLLTHNLVDFHAFGKSVEDGLMHQAVERLRASNGTEPRRDARGLMPESFRTPGYPAFLAGVFSVRDDLRAAVLVQCVLGALGTVLVVLIAQGLGLSSTAALIAGFLWAVHPALVLYDNLILTESLFNFAALVAIAIACRASGPVGSIAAGLVLGLTGLIRPVGLAYVPLAIAAGSGRQPRRWFSAFLLVTAAILPSAMWAARNRAVGEGFRVSTVGDLNLLFYSAAFMDSEERGDDWLTSWPRRVSEMEDDLAGRLQPGEDVISAARRLALSKMLARPALAAKVHAKSQVKLLVDHSAGDFAAVLGREYRPTGLFSRLVLGGNQQNQGGDTGQVVAVLAWLILNVVILSGAALGVLLGLWRRGYRLLLGCVLTIGLLMAATGCVGLERFRLPMMLPLFLLAASVRGLRTNPTNTV
jgi:hypothetical protein